MTASYTRTDFLDKLLFLFNKASIPCQIDQEIEARIWEKVAFNAALNTLCSVVQSPISVLADSEHGPILARQIVEEVLSIACAKGIPVNSNTVYDNVQMAMNEHREHKPSMLQDLLAGRPTEIDSINGTVISCAHQMDISIPVTETFLRVIKLLESK